MKRDDKNVFVESLKKDFASMAGAVIADYRGTDVERLTQLRRSLQGEGAVFKVIKNTLAKRAVEGSEAAGLDAAFEGPTAIAYSMTDEIAAARIIAKFLKENKNIKFNVRAGYLPGKVLTKAQVEALAKLPGKEELVGKLLYLLNYPISGLVNVLNQCGAQKLVYALSAIQKKKEQTA